MSVAKDVNKIALSSTQNAANLTQGMTGQNLGGQYQGFLGGARNNLVNQATNYMPTAVQDYGNLTALTQGPAADRLINGAITGAGYGSTTAANAMGMQSALMPYARQLLGYGQSLLPYGQQLFGQGQNLFDQSRAMFGQMPALYNEGQNLYGQANETYGRAGDLYSQGQNLFAHEQPLYKSGNRIAEMGFDPQSALYARTLQQIQDQQRAAGAARGIGASPYGAALEGDASRNFNIDWQNQQLQRAISAGGAQAGLYGQAAELGTAGGGLYGQGAGMVNAAANLAGAGTGAYNAAANLGQTAGGLAQQGGGLYGQGADIGRAASDIGQGAAAIDTSAFNLGSGATDLAARAAALPYTARQSILNDRLNADRGAYDARTGLIQDQINATTNLGGQTQAINAPRQQVISDYLATAGLGPGFTNASANTQNANTNTMSTLLHLIGK